MSFHLNELPAPVSPDDVASDFFPLSFAQERLWFLDELDPGQTSYHIPYVVRLRGSLDADALERALGRLALRHEALRTTVTLEEGRPLARIAPAGIIPLVREECVGPGAPDPMDRLAAAARESFDLRRSPLARALLLRLGPAEHLQELTLHHIVTDGWSMGILLVDLAALYEAEIGTGPEPPSSSELGYADYAVLQRALLTGPYRDEFVAWWQEALPPDDDGRQPVLTLPADRPRPAVQEPHRRGCPARPRARARGGSPPTRPGARSDALHGPALRLRGPACPLERSTRRPGWNPDREPD